MSVASEEEWEKELNKREKEGKEKQNVRVHVGELSGEQNNPCARILSYISCAFFPFSSFVREARKRWEGEGEKTHEDKTPTRTELREKNTQEKNTQNNNAGEPPNGQMYDQPRHTRRRRKAKENKAVQVIAREMRW